MGGSEMHMALLDWEKAFDRVYHEKLFEKHAERAKEGYQARMPPIAISVRHPHDDTIPRCASRERGKKGQTQWGELH
eukprot:7256222-Karenia_brevis.AAC.1